MIGIVDVMVADLLLLAILLRSVIHLLATTLTLQTEHATRPGIGITTEWVATRRRMEATHRRMEAMLITAITHLHMRPTVICRQVVGILLLATAIRRQRATRRLLAIRLQGILRHRATALLPRATAQLHRLITTVIVHRLEGTVLTAGT